MANTADPDQLASSDQLIWIYTVCKGRTYPGPAGQGLSLLSEGVPCHSNDMTFGNVNSKSSYNAV